jgi:hypothetical protein
MKKTAKIILQIFLAIATVLTLGAGKTIALSGAHEGAEAAKTAEMPSELIGDDGTFTRITNIILYIVGIIAVIMIIWGGIRYITSGGDQKKVTDAKNTVLYSVLGLVIAILSYAIVNFVLNTVGTGDVQVDQQSSEQQ